MTYATSNAQELKWYSWNDGYKFAKQENKKMLVFVQADWCHWCRRMEEKTYNNEEIRSSIQQNFVAIKFDVEQVGELNYDGNSYNAKDLISKISKDECRGIPGTLFVDVKNNTSVVEMGFRTPDDMKPLLEKYSKKI